jgi:CcmD family protein
VSNLGWLAAAFGITWVAIGLYVLTLARAQRDIRRRLEHIERTSERRPES